MRVGGDYIKFEEVGDSVSGIVLSVGAHRWDDGTVSPQIVLDTDEGEKTVTAGQVRLKAALAEKRPEVGDLLSITYTELEKRTGGKTLKHFDVKVAPAGKKPAAKKDVLDGVDPDVLAALQEKLGAKIA
jgi:hypothetical protein